MINKNYKWNAECTIVAIGVIGGLALFIALMWGLISNLLKVL